MVRGSLFLGLCFAFSAWSAEDSLEQLLGVSVDEKGITFQVESNGCTNKDDFKFEVQEILERMSPMLPAYEHHFYITVKRLHEDNCEVYIPYGTRIFMSFEELGIQFGKFHVNNPIGGDMVMSMR